MIEAQKKQLTNSMDTLLDKFTEYFKSRGDEEIERKIYFRSETVKGKEYEVVVGEVVYSEPVPETDRLGNWAVIRRLKQLTVEPQLHIYTLGYKVERISGSDSGFGAIHDVSSDVLRAVAGA